MMNESIVQKLEINLVLSSFVLEIVKQGKREKISKPLGQQSYTLSLKMLSSMLVHGTTLEVSGLVSNPSNSLHG